MPAPANDDFANATVITGAFGSAGPVTIDAATVDTDDPTGGVLDSYIFAPAQTIWFKYVTTGDVGLIFDTRGSLDTGTPGELDTTIAVFADADLLDPYTALSTVHVIDATTIYFIAGNDDVGGGDVWSEVDMPSEPFPFLIPEGTTLWIRVGTSGGGYTGTVTLNWRTSVLSEPQGLVVAYDDDPLAETPGWFRLDDPDNGTLRTAEWDTRAGRSSELDTTAPGTASIRLIDPDGSYDFTNPLSSVVQYLHPGRQAAIALEDPDGAWHTRFRGWIDEVLVDIDLTERFATLTVELVDALTYLSRVEMMPATFGDPLPTGVEGDIYFGETSGAGELSDRMNQVLDTVGFPVGMRRLFTGNVQLQATVYSRREPVMTVLEEAADAEFPDVANLYAAKDGILTFHGRQARFDPSTYSSPNDLSRSGGNSICFWSAVDEPTLVDSPTSATIRGLSYRVSVNDVLNDVLTLPANVDETDIGAGFVDNSSSKGLYGWHTETFENLRTLSGPMGSTALEEATKVSTYYTDNYAAPRVRITQLRFVNVTDPDKRLVCGVDIGDVITVTTRQFNGDAGFAEDYFVEQITMNTRPGGPGGDGEPLVEMTLDVSPRAFYDTNPFA